MQHLEIDGISTEQDIGDIPDALIYEKSRGRTLYYEGYRQYLSGAKDLEELMGSSYLQSFIIMTIVKYLLRHLPDDYHVFTNELGVMHQPGSWRALDIAVYRKTDLRDIPLENRYLQIPPEIAIEIDTKADVRGFNTAMDYVYEKTDDLLEFGVGKVIRMFTSSRKILVAEPREKWVTVDWSDSVSIMEGVEINLEEMIKANAPGMK